MEKISAVYKIVNTVTGDFYVGSSKNVYRRWAEHKRPSNCNKCPNNKLYQEMQKHGVDKFRFQILAPVMPEHLKQVEQEFIELLHPTYNNNSANGQDVVKMKAAKKKYLQSEKGKEARKKYEQSEKGKEARNKAQRKYQQSEKGKEYDRKYKNQTCVYNGETLTLNTLRVRFSRAGIKHPFAEAKKYILDEK